MAIHLQRSMETKQRQEEKRIWLSLVWKERRQRLAKCFYYASIVFVNRPLYLLRKRTVFAQVEKRIWLSLVWRKQRESQISQAKHFSLQKCGLLRTCFKVSLSFIDIERSFLPYWQVTNVFVPISLHFILSKDIYCTNMWYSLFVILHCLYCIYTGHSIWVVFDVPHLYCICTKCVLYLYRWQNMSVGQR